MMRAAPLTWFELAFGTSMCADAHPHALEDLLAAKRSDRHTAIQTDRDGLGAAC